MLFKRTMWMTVVGVSALTLAGTPRETRAAVLASEGYNYTADGTSLNGKGGGTGFAAAWADADNDVLLSTSAGSLSYPAGVTLTPTGTRVELTAADTAAAATRQLATGMSLATGGNVFYASGLFRRSAVSGEQSLVQFRDTVAGNIRWSFGINNAGSFLVSVNPTDANQVATGGTAAADTTYLIVARIRTNTGTGGNDEVFLQAYGPGDTVIAEPAADTDWQLRSSGGSSVTLTFAELLMANAAGATNQFDELRVGTTFADVTGVPEPASVGVLAVAAVGLLARRCRGR
jgi:hypothetical protein